MKKIGIITHYYKNKNYGGVLQAYALCKVLQKQNYQAEQICYQHAFARQSRLKSLFSQGIAGFFKQSFRYAKRLIVKPFEKLEEKKHDIYNRREQAFLYFSDREIAHSEKVYTKATISKSVDDYDAFITGSDQVWNVDGYDASYFLDFVPCDKLKISYAASVAKESLTQAEQEIFKKNLRDYKAVSVREENAVGLLKDLSPVTPQWALDPTLLLSRSDWDEVCEERLIDEKYIFCYFLGDNKKERQLAKETAKRQGVKLVTLPYVSGIKLMDRNFGDERKFDVTPQQFLSLIKHAESVFTDSFHAVVFSNVYQKNYFVFNRNKKGTMRSRIVDATKLFGQEERYCSGKERENIDYIQSLPSIDYTKDNLELERCKRSSLQFLKDNLG